MWQYETVRNEDIYDVNGDIGGYPERKKKIFLTWIIMKKHGALYAIFDRSSYIKIECGRCGCGGGREKFKYIH